jgi:chorismate mutase/prephenate dehydratase
VYAHAQSLAQCHEWLNQNLPYAERISVVSNAEGARQASQEANSAALGSQAAAAAYQLNVLSANIEDQPNNTTRFLVIANQEAAPSGRDKTSLAMSTLNRPGAMHDLRAPACRAGVDMTRMEPGLAPACGSTSLRGDPSAPAGRARRARLGAACAARRLFKISVLIRPR